MDRLTDVNRPDWMKMDATKKMLCERLWQYENTGLDPQQIKDMQFCLREKSRECGELRRELQEIKNQKNDGWISVDEPPKKDYIAVFAVDKHDYYFAAVYDKEHGYRTNDVGADVDNIVSYCLFNPYRPERSEE